MRTPRTGRVSGHDSSGRVYRGGFGAWVGMALVGAPHPVRRRKTTHRQQYWYDGAGRVPPLFRTPVRRSVTRSLEVPAHVLLVGVARIEYRVVVELPPHEHESDRQAVRFACGHRDCGVARYVEWSGVGEHVQR